MTKAEVNKECPHFSAGNLRRTCLHLGDADRAAIQKIREELELPSSALAVRMAVRRLAERLARPEATQEQGEELAKVYRLLIRADEGKHD